MSSLAPGALPKPAALRPFQAAVVERAREANVVMVGATGIGKTFVAIALLSEQDYSGGKRAFVLAPTRQLVWQIAAKIRMGTTLRAGAFCGRDMEQWGEREWARELAVTRVLVCTPEVLRNALERGLVRMAQINLLVFDECHHVTKRHPYAHVIKMYDAAEAEKQELPRVFGTTATPTRDCAKNLHAEAIRVELEAEETAAYAAVAPIQLEEYDKEPPPVPESPVPEPARGRGIVNEAEEENDDGHTALERWEARDFQRSSFQKLDDILNELQVAEVLCKLLRKGKSGAARDPERLDKLVRKFLLGCVEIYRGLGLWCVYRFVELEIERSAINASLLLSIPGSYYGYDKAAITLIMAARAKREKCKFAATKRLQKVAALLKERLVSGEDSTSSQSTDESGEEEEEYDDDDDEEEEQPHSIHDSDSHATTEDADGSVVSGEIDGEISAANARSVVGSEAAAPRSPQRLQGIVFVTTRAECRVVCEYLNERLGGVGRRSNRDSDDNSDDDDSDNDNDNNDGDDLQEKEPLFACILGQAASRDTASFGLPNMEETLAKFEKGSIPFLVSTAVSVEGVDFPQCALIIVASRVQAARKLIQLRGRARHQDGVVYYLYEAGDREHEMHFRTMEVEAEAIANFDFQHDKQESVFQQPRSLVSKQLAGFDYFPEEARLCVGATGAVLDLDSSIARLNMFCQTLPKQLCVVDLKNMYSYAQTTVQKRPLFSATVRLPEALDLPAFTSKPMHSKSTAKAAVAFEACKYLYEHELLDDSLNSVYRKGKPDDLSYLMRKLHH